MKLYELAEQYRADVEKLQDLDLPPEAVLDTIDSMQGELVEKVRAVVIVAMELQAEADVRSDHAKRMAESAASLANRAASLRSYAQIVLQNAGVALPLNFPEFTVNLAKNPRSVEIIDAGKLPAPYVQKTVKFTVAHDRPDAELKRALEQLAPYASGEITVDVVPDKRAIATALKDESTSDQFMGAARLAPQSYRLTVK